MRVRREREFRRYLAQKARVEAKLNLFFHINKNKAWKRAEHNSLFIVEN